MMTKAVNREKLEKYMVMVRQRDMEGRAKEGLQVKKDNEESGKEAPEVSEYEPRSEGQVRQRKHKPRRSVT